MSGSRIHPYLGPLVALLVVLALGAGTVYAAIPNSNGKYYACYVKNTGVVKLINYPKVGTCPKGEKLINWNAKGPQGPAGPQGPQGPVGPQGPAGTAGVTKITMTTHTSSGLIIPTGGTRVARDFSCPTGKLMGGGYYNNYPNEVYVSGSFPLNPTTWRVWADNADVSDLDVYIWINCMTTDPGTVIARLSPAVKKAMVTTSKGAGNKKGGA